MIHLPNISNKQLKTWLTPKEYECYILTQEGKIGKQIAQELFLESRQAVYKMQKRIIIKINQNLT